MSDGQSTDNLVTFREFAASIAEVKSLMLTLDRNREESSRVRHESIGDRFITHEAKMMAIGDRLSAKMDDHQKKDDLVAERVLLLEQASKRNVNILSVAIPSFMVGWEFIRSKFFGK